MPTAPDMAARNLSCAAPETLLEKATRKVKSPFEDIERAVVNYQHAVQESAPFLAVYPQERSVTCH